MVFLVMRDGEGEKMLKEENRCLNEPTLVIQFTTDGH